MNSKNIPEFEDIKEKRKWLSAISRPLKALVEAGEVDSVNTAILEMYQSEFPNAEFNTFHGWRKKGFAVKKGAKSFIIWGQPRSITKPIEDSKSDETEKEEEFFPIAYLFSSLQVNELKKAN